jgi:hypothetical protein
MNKKDFSLTLTGGCEVVKHSDDVLHLLIELESETERKFYFVFPNRFPWLIVDRDFAV